MNNTLVIENDHAPIDLNIDESLNDDGPVLDDDSDAESVTSVLDDGVPDGNVPSDDESTEGSGDESVDGSGDDDDDDGDGDGDGAVKPDPLLSAMPSGVANTPATLMIDTDDDGDVTESDDEDWTERLKQGGLIAEDGTLGSELLAEHPETQSINVDEVRAAANVIRNSRGVIIDTNHTTTPLITKYEKAKILGIRAEQLSGGGQPAIEIPNDGMTSMEIAYAEYQARKIPFIIRRPLPSGRSEYWRVADLQDVSY